MKKNIRWGILGCGNIAQNCLLNNLLQSEKLPLNKSLKVLKIMDKIRKKLGWFIQMINKKLMLEATLFRKNHCYSVFIASRNNLTIFYRATRLYNSLYTSF